MIDESKLKNGKMAPGAIIGSSEFAKNPEMFFDKLVGKLKDHGITSKEGIVEKLAEGLGRQTAQTLADILSTQGERLKGFTGMMNVAQNLDGMFKTIQATASQHFENLNKSLDTLAGTIGSKVIEPFNALSDAATRLTNSFNHWLNEKGSPFFNAPGAPKPSQPGTPGFDETTSPFGGNPISFRSGVGIGIADTLGQYIIEGFRVAANTIRGGASSGVGTWAENGGAGLIRASYGGGGKFTWNGKSPNVPGGAYGGHVAPWSEREAFIRENAPKFGVDPDYAVAVAKSEGARRFFGDGGRSGGDFQLFTGGGIGNQFARERHKNPLDPHNWKESDLFALREIQRQGWGPWHGAAKIGIRGRAGIHHIDGKPNIDDILKLKGKPEPKPAEAPKKADDIEASAGHTFNIVQHIHPHPQHDNKKIAAAVHDNFKRAVEDQLSDGYMS